METNSENTINTSKNTIEQLFNMFETEIYEYTETNKDLLSKIVNLEKNFYSKLNEEQKQDYEKINDLKLLNTEETDKNIFKYAFSFATRLILESMK